MVNSTHSLPPLHDEPVPDEYERISTVTTVQLRLPASKLDAMPEGDRHGLDQFLVLLFISSMLVGQRT